MTEADKKIVDRVKECLMPILGDYGLELVDIEFRSSGKRWLLRIFIDKEGGVLLSDCEKISRELSSILDVEDFIDHPYTLEVSSPGITRPLKTMDDFKRSIGRVCRVITSEPVSGKREIKGVILSAKEEEIQVKGKIDIFTIPLCAIKKANLDFEI
ncbi:MAG TPA: ribosome maturation factor RimP [Syntrophorhabdaceae bacterium]|nr:ribosome maturation factor RimP [Syntrophorhabdaceae bacterium]